MAVFKIKKLLLKSECQNIVIYLHGYSGYKSAKTHALKMMILP